MFLVISNVFINKVHQTLTMNLNAFLNVKLRFTTTGAPPLGLMVVVAPEEHGVLYFYAQKVATLVVASYLMGTHESRIDRLSSWPGAIPGFFK